MKTLGIVQSGEEFGNGSSAVTSSAAAAIFPAFIVAVSAAILPVGKLADTSNSGTLLAFAMVSIGVLILRKTQPNRVRPFRTPFAWVVCPLAVAGCLLLFVNLSPFAKLFFVGWAIFGLILYRLYGYKRSHLANGTESPN
jgi:APA family basic amino acid/polyamine antiporter